METLAELKEKTKAKLEHDKKHEEEHFIQNAVIGKAVENAQIDLPEAMIANEVDRMMNDFAQRLQQQGLKLRLILPILWSRRRSFKRPNERRSRRSSSHKLSS